MAKEEAERKAKLAKAKKENKETKKKPKSKWTRVMNQKLMKVRIIAS